MAKLRTKYLGELPSRTNEGGLWIFNPAEPVCHPTNLNDIVFVTGETTPANHGQIVLPPAVEVTFKGPGRDEWIYEKDLVGRHVLNLHRVDPIAAKNGGGYEFSAQYHSASIETTTGPYSVSFTPLWTLFFGRVILTAGPYWQPGPADGVNSIFEDGWFLASVLGGDGFGGTQANHVYAFGYPLRDQSTQFQDADLREQLIFDPLGSNVLSVQNWPGDFPENTAVGGHPENLEVTISAIWP